MNETAFYIIEILQMLCVIAVVIYAVTSSSIKYELEIVLLSICNICLSLSMILSLQNIL